MDENSFWTLIWKLVAVFLCVLTVSAASCTAYTTYRITESKDPVAAGCALSDRYNQHSCMVLMGRR